MIAISNQYAGKLVRIVGVIQSDDANPTVGLGNYIGIIENVEGSRFRFTFKEDGLYGKQGKCTHLQVRVWRIAEVIDVEPAQVLPTVAQ